MQAAHDLNDMKALQTFEVYPRVPERLSLLLAIAYDLWWSWQHDAIQLFRSIDAGLWQSTGHNPVAMLGAVQQSRLDELARDESFTSRLDELSRRFREYKSGPTWFSRAHGAHDSPRIVYLSAEFGLTECLPIYSGGLGLLAGDHMKAASELGIPLVGVGLLYERGYFVQSLTADGWQQESYHNNDFINMPVRPLVGPEGHVLKIKIEFPRRIVTAQVWDVHVGRVRVFLLDTNTPENSAEDSRITSELYGGDIERRVQQEIILGVGGIRAVQALGWRCSACHLNEGHSAFSAIERARALVADHGWTSANALELVRKTTIFTTHTSVAAGIDQFPESLMQGYFGEFARQLGMSWSDFMALGRLDSSDRTAPFNLMSLALNLSYRANAVSQLHGQVSRRMNHGGWNGTPVEEVPIRSVTNGVHAHSWVSHEISLLFERHLGKSWISDPADHSVWKRIENIPDDELWRVHEYRRGRLVDAARGCLVRQLERRGGSDQEIQLSRGALNPDALTIGFARRFAPYKRATLLLRDKERLKRLLASSDRPIQLIIAGKAHPHDQSGKELIREIIRFSQDPQVRGRVIFLEDYEISMARNLVQGVDLWINTPRRPMEACGTSGMKVVFNGGLNASILDGWWDEAHERELGWAIGMGEEYSDWNLQDQVESQRLYDLLESEIIPLFYERASDGLPHGWITRMKQSMLTLCPRFNANRMVGDYTEQFYLPAIRDCDLFSRNREQLDAFCQWKEKIRRHWDGVAVMSVEFPDGGRTAAGEAMTVRAAVALGGLEVNDVRVELYYGLVGEDSEILGAQTLPLDFTRMNEAGTYAYSGALKSSRSGRYGYSVRVRPAHDLLTHEWEMRLVRWASGQVRS